MFRTPWIEPKFTFDCPEGCMEDILERLRGKGDWIRGMTEGIPEEKRELRLNGKWSVKEHIGHLSDLEDLYIGRIEDFLLRRMELRPADMSNAKRYIAQHNEKGIKALISEFT